ncbi:hypothetical protein [Xanthomonas sp. CFBP 8445]|uniref:hypothetical protein n=1 Tax=Xanthomonas sp. CFBP 8445 TaxID=2971236 RepID=UPI0021E0828A|nr:hypothetical protein [Xanthomonas sp. CFBP 8445]UYC12671.1 hypothetical protein NUG21_02685 [Xanthomonas sp. CFBP 8445]
MSNYSGSVIYLRNHAIKHRHSRFIHAQATVVRVEAKFDIIRVPLGNRNGNAKRSDPRPEARLQNFHYSTHVNLTATKHLRSPKHGV